MDFKDFTVTGYQPNQNQLNLRFTMKKFNSSIKTVFEYSAPSPPNRRSSYTGSGLPFPDSIVAFDKTPNSGKFELNSPVFEIHLSFPNAYYTHLGTKLVYPHLLVKIHKGSYTTTEDIELGEVAPYRLLTYPQNRSGASFYDRSHLTTARSQESILRSSSYPSCPPRSTYSNFWGSFVPHT